jgi:hypothetical protein
MANLTMDHGVSGCFGTRLAPKRTRKKSILIFEVHEES